MGGEFEGELIRQYFTASEAPWQNGLVERNGGIWKAAVKQRCLSTRFRGNAKSRLHGELGEKRSHYNSSGFR